MARDQCAYKAIIDEGTGDRFFSRTRHEIFSRALSPITKFNLNFGNVAWLNSRALWMPKANASFWLTKPVVPWNILLIFW